ncbi:hypothetical protein CBW57_23200 [Yersinia intermedia]|uniref:Uncharacterized protein n=2 Tax=Yersinia intermedia TaxID=631 RepID=A0A208ZHB2_YERIN|nr:hypothetical protein CBW57_23200 [Yersinia intermedia]
MGALIMDTRFIVRFDFRSQVDDIEFSEVLRQFNFIVEEIDDLFQTKKKWYEQGYSRKQALSQVAFEDGTISERTHSKWIRRFNKDKPLFIEGVWDAGDDDHSCGISYRKMFYDERNRVSVELSLVPQSEKVTYSNFVVFISRIASFFNCSYVNVDSKGYGVLGKNVFPDRLCVGWMLYVPHFILPELIQEAAKVIPVMDADKPKGTIIVSTEDVFDGNNKEHIGKANDVEIKLLDLGFLPLITEL